MSEIIYIESKDSEWHPMNTEMPPHTTNVELLKPDGKIIRGEIVVDMAGYYIYLNHGWGCPDDYTHWRFIKGDNYPDYQKEQED